MASNLTIALTFVLVLNALMFLAQEAVLDLNDDTEGFYNAEGSLITTFESDGSLDTDGLDNLPTGEGSISPTTGNFFTDTFSSIKRWFTQLPGVNYIYGIVMAPYNMLQAMGLPQQLRYVLGALWYGITFFLVVAFLWGRT